MRARKAAVQYGHPSKGLRLIIVTGTESTTAARLLAELMREADQRVAVFTEQGSLIEDIPYNLDYQQSSSAVQQALSAARKQRCGLVIMQASGVLAKSQMLATLYIDMALVTSDDDIGQTILKQSLVYAVIPHGLSTENLLIAPHQMISVGDDEGAEAQMSDVKLYRRGTELTLTVDHQTVIELATHLVGRANAVAAAYAAAAGYVLGVSVDVIPEGIARLESLPANFQSIEPENNPFQIAVDRANQEADVSSLITSAKRITKRRLIAVFDSTVDSQAIEKVRGQIDRLVGIDGHSPALTDEASDLTEAVALARRAAKKDDLVLLVGGEFATVTPDGSLRAEAMIEVGRGDK